MNWETMIHFSSVSYRRTLGCSSKGIKTLTCWRTLRISESAFNFPVPQPIDENVRLYRKNLPLSVISVGSIFRGRSLVASPSKSLWLSASPFPSSSGSISSEPRRAGLFEIFISFVIKARDLAMDPEIKEFREFWWRNMLKTEFCSWVGLTKTTYSTIRVNLRPGFRN